MLEQRKSKNGFTFFYYIIKLIINLAGIFLGTIIGFLFFYPLIFSFPNVVLIVFIELYIIILSAIIFKRLFNKMFCNYVDYKPLFYRIRLGYLFNTRNLLLSFYILGLIFVFFFIFGHVLVAGF